MKDLCVSLHVGEEDIMKILNVPDVEHLLYEKEAALSRAKFGSGSPRVIKDFKKSIAFKIIIQDRIQEARNHIYNVEVKALEQQYIDEGFIRSFLKGVRLVHHRTIVKVKGLTLSQASDDSPSNSGEGDIKSELRKAFSSNDEIIEIV
ncbi:hypothetical protein IEQ34_005603 [Dendrobium chrysotoxum]|uniref:Ribosomal protein L9 n=1 Tax=Dendrobium chrysotoxum TaxID=161865 RepID=A0AAV7HDI1_DENCH|nr:hypothetical protein IEQ34_005603 [Dendrobium chrysotoxum]